MILSDTESYDQEKFHGMGLDKFDTTTPYYKSLMEGAVGKQGTKLSQNVQSQKR